MKDKDSNSNPNRRGRFPNPNRKGRFSYPNHDREGGYPSPNEYRMKVEILLLVGILILNPSWIEFMRWRSSLTWLMFIEKQVKFVAYKLKRGAAAWWDQLQSTRRRQNKPSVMMWRLMKQLLKGRFLLPDYQQILYDQFKHGHQCTRIVAIYTEEFYRLLLCCDLSMTKEQQAAKYISGLKYSI